MALMVKDNKTAFTPAPEGLRQAVCVDVVDLGMVTDQWGTKHKAELVWQLDQKNPETGKRFTVRKRYTLSLHQKAVLRIDLESWRGKKFSNEELDGFDLEKLLGINAQVQVVHTLADNGRVLSNVRAVVPIGKGMTKLRGEYVRAKDRPQTNGNGNGGGNQGGTHGNHDASTPF